MIKDNHRMKCKEKKLCTVHLRARNHIASWMTDDCSSSIPHVNLMQYPAVLSKSTVSCNCQSDGFDLEP